MKNRHLWHYVSFRLVLSAVLLVGGATVAFAGEHISGNKSINRKLAAIAGIVVFVIFAVIFLQVFSAQVRRFVAAHRPGTRWVAATQVMLRTTGYIAILLATLDLLGIPIGRILLGGAVLTVTLGVAAQQALANVFASLVLVISRPFTVGQDITLHSGVLAGKFNGTVVDIGLIHTQIQEEDGNIVFVPNSVLVSAAAIRKTLGRRKVK